MRTDFAEPSELPELKFYFLVITSHRIIGPTHAQIDVFPDYVEFRLHDESVGILNRDIFRAWLNDPDRVLVTGEISLTLDDHGLVISIGQDVRRSPILNRTTQQLCKII